ncbi:MAG: L-rhamnose mutarotase [Eubacteriales bacterium]|nr:L-rhamnose mutarotase [Eubacteriales bacterium]
MERFAWKGRIKEGMEEEYKRRHDEIWPEMKALLKAAGIRNYSIWSDGITVFGYYECEHGVAYAEKAQAGSPIVDRWNAYMQDVLDMQMDAATGVQPMLRQMFLLE